MDEQRNNFDAICAQPERMSADASRGLAPGIYPASVYRCDDPDQADGLMSGKLDGFIYQRDRHPNADMLSEKLRQMHAADWALVTSSGMAALSLATLSLLQAGDHLVVSDRLYGRTTQQLTEKLSRLSITSTIVDTLDLDAVESAMRPTTRLIVIETLTNPMLRVMPLADLAELAHRSDALLLVDNTFASPFVCRPIEFGADLVMESVSKMINGHSDVMLGALLGRGEDASTFRETSSVWGLASSPFDSWLACRGAATLHLRMERACQNALETANRLAAASEVTSVAYPGLTNHPDHLLAKSQFARDQFGCMISFQLPGGRESVSKLIAAADQIPFCPSLGEVSTTLSHPASTSHRRMDATQCARLGISEGTIRLSVGSETVDWIWQMLSAGLATAAT